MGAIANDMKALMEVYPHDRLLGAYIKGQSPYSTEAQQWLDAGEKPTEILHMIINAAEGNQPLMFEAEVTPVPEPEKPITIDGAETDQELAERRRQEFIAKGERELERSVKLSERIASEISPAIEKQQERAGEGLLGKATGFLGSVIGQKEVERVAAQEAGIEAALKGRKMIMGGITSPIVEAAKAEVAKASYLFQPPWAPETGDQTYLIWKPEVVEHLITTADTKDQIQKVRDILFRAADAGLLPTEPAESYSKEAQKKIVDEGLGWLFTSPNISKMTRGKYKLPELVSTEFLQQHPNIGAGLQTAGQVAEVMIIEDFEDPVYWPFWLIGYAGGKFLIGPGMKGIEAAAASQKPAIWNKVARGLKFDFGKSWQNFVRSQYNKPIVKQLLSKSTDIPASSVQNFLRGADDQFLQDNPIIWDALIRISEGKDPGVFERMILEPLRKAKAAGTLDDLTLEMRLPRTYMPGKRYKINVQETGAVAKQHPSQAILKAIARNEGDETAALVNDLMIKGIGTTEASARPNLITIALADDVPDEAITDLMKGPLGMLGVDIEDAPAYYTIQVKPGRVEEVRRYIQDLPQYADAIQASITPEVALSSLDDMKSRGWVDDDFIENIRREIDLPEKPVPAKPAGQPAGRIEGQRPAPPPAAAVKETVSPSSAAASFEQRLLTMSDDEFETLASKGKIAPFGNKDKDLVEAVYSGKKPAATIVDPYYADIAKKKYKLNVDEIDYSTHSLTKENIDFIEDNNIRTFVVYKNDKEAAEVIKQMIEPVGNVADDIRYHIKVGKAYGYSDEDIAAYLANQHTISKIQSSLTTGSATLPIDIKYAGKSISQVDLNRYILGKPVPSDLKRLRNHPAAVKGFDSPEVKPEQVEDYVRRIGRLVNRYFPDRKKEFENVYVKQQMGQAKAGDFEKFKQYAHKEMPRLQFHDEMQLTGKTDPFEAAKIAHRMAVEADLREGRHVPEKVLKDYPDLVAKYPATQPPTEAVKPAPIDDYVEEFPDRYRPDGWFPLQEEIQPADPGFYSSGREIGRQLGWSDDALDTMRPEELSRVISQGIGPEHGRITPGGTVQPATIPREVTAQLADVMPMPAAEGIVSKLDRQTIMNLYGLYTDPRGLTPAAMLKVIADQSPELAKALKGTMGIPADDLMDAIARVIQGRIAEPNYLTDTLQETSKELWHSSSERVKETIKAAGRKVKTGAKKTGFKPEPMADEAMEAYYRSAMARRENTWKQWPSVAKKNLQEQADVILTDRVLRKNHPQFVDDMRTQFQQLGVEASQYSDATLGMIFHDLSKVERGEVLRLIALRDAISTAGDDIAIQFTESELLDELGRRMGRAPQRIIDALNRYETIAEAAAKQMVSNGHIKPSQLRSQYMRHYVAKYTPDWLLRENYVPGTPRRGQKVFRPYMKQRINSMDDIIISENGLRTQFADIYFDDAVDNWIQKQYKTYDLWDRLVKPGMTDEEAFNARGAIFGFDEDGKLLKPHPGQLYEVPGSPELWKGVQFQRGNQWYRTEGVNSKSALANFLEDLGLATANNSEEMVSNIDLHGLSEGMIPQELLNMLDTAGVREGPVLRALTAIGRQHRTYVLPESMANKMLRMKDQYVINFPGLYQAMKFTSAWKRLTLTWAGAPFQSGNMMGDTKNLWRVGGNDAVLKIPKAVKIVANMARPEGQDIRLLGRMKDVDYRVLRVAKDKGIFDSVFYAQFNQFRKLKMDLNPKNIFLAYEKFGAMREATTRVALVAHLLDEYDRTGKIVVPGFMRRLYKNGKLVLDPESAIGYVGRKFTIDYAEGPDWFNRLIRGTFFPFMTFYQKNAGEWARYIAENPLGYAAKFIAPRVAVNFWNNTMFPRTEGALSGAMIRRGHVNLGELDMDGDGIDDYGIVLGPNMPDDMALQWIGLDRIEETISNVRRGRMTPEEAAKDFLANFGIKPALVMSERLMNPVLQAIDSLVRNKDVRTGQPILEPHEKDLPELDKSLIRGKYFLRAIAAPMAQYAMVTEDVRMDLWDVFGIAPKGKFWRSVAKGPFDIWRALGLYLVPLDREASIDFWKSEEGVAGRRAALQIDAYRIFNDWARKGGNSWDYKDSASDFWKQPEIARLFEDAKVDGVVMNADTLDIWYSSERALIDFYSEIVNNPDRTKQEKLDAKNAVKLLEGIRDARQFEQVPEKERPAILQRLLEIEKRKEGR